MRLSIHNFRTCRHSSLALVCFATLCSPALASDGLDRDVVLFGDTRAALAERGVATRLRYIGEAASNVRSAQRRRTAYAWELHAGSDVDLDTLWGWRGFRASLSASLRGGTELNTLAGLGALVPMQQIHGRGQQGRLGNLWLGWQSADARLGFKAGRLPLHEDFNGTGCEALHLAFCSGQALTFEGDYWFAGPVTQWGAVAQFNPSARTYMRLGAYQVNPRYANERSGGWRLAPSGTLGTLTPVELGWQPQWRGGLPGRYAIGGWYSSASRAAADPSAGTPGWPGTDDEPLMMRTGTYGGWFMAEQQFSRGAAGDESGGLRGQFAYTQGDRRTGTVDRMVHLLGTWTGFHPDRPDDQLGLGLAATHVNSNVARYWQSIGRSGHANEEYVAEAFYRWQALSAVALQPSIQYVVHPGGRSDGVDALIVGLRVALRF